MYFLEGQKRIILKWVRITALKWFIKGLILGLTIGIIGGYIFSDWQFRNIIKRQKALIEELKLGYVPLRRGK